MLQWLREFNIRFSPMDKSRSRRPPPNFFVPDDAVDPGYNALLERTLGLATEAKVLAVIPQREIQRSSLNTNIFLS